MKWGRKKSTTTTNHSAQSSRSSVFSKVFPVSWISKFKQMGIKSESKHARTKRKTKPMSPSLNSTPRRHPKDSAFSPEVTGRRMSQRRSKALTEIDGDDDYWRLSFGGESSDGKKSRAPLRSVWYDSEDDLEFPPRSSCRSCRSAAMTTRTEQSPNFTNMVSDIRKTRGSPANVKCEIPKDSKVTSRKSRKSGGRIAEKEQFLSHIENQQSSMGLNPIETSQTTVDQNYSSRQSLYVSSDSRKTTASVETTQQIGSDSVKKKAKDLKIEFLSRNEKQGKSAYISGELQRRTKQSCKVRVSSSPRTPSKSEVCKIKALEDMKKAKMKKMKMKERAVEETTSTTGLESFAIEKCSLDPEEDFRDSMVEMISENKIGRMEEFEELLACYLTLNSDEYHDLIIKVFKQVWFELKVLSFSPDLQKDKSP
ncbi:hypothetical protein NE237_031177 [Protea cynaroides]|uniref:Transcription repressor n=1 Tax=Protea cynaroides TaxID=273540 RepID=A0A9Q0R2C0_9MAGN|nr:hypothetical protein NE237_031177 [Protea cynaroides]